ncbi:MAG: hypothetical protein KAI17_23530, partial [Thiotrichaceae bacterium]|nr:hypothetical protein [Thiotrichaceae bacterium]
MSRTFSCDLSTLEEKPIIYFKYHDSKLDMEDTEKKRSWAEILKHPTANMIIGFLLTGIIGTSITNYYSMKQRQEKQHDEMVETNKKAVASL